MASQNGKALTKNELRTKLSEESGVAKKEVGQVMDALENVIVTQVGKKGVFQLPGLIKIAKAVRPATKERQGRNPATGEAMTIAAKPKRTVVKARVLKKLKDVVLS